MSMWLMAQGASVLPETLFHLLPKILHAGIVSGVEFEALTAEPRDAEQHGSDGRYL